MTQRKNRKVDQGQHENILKASKNGDSLRVIAGRFGISHQAVSNILKQFPDYVVERVHKSVPEDKHQEIIDRHKAGETLKSIAYSIGVSTGTVKSTLERLNAYTKRGAGFTDKQCLDILVHFNQGMTRRELAVKYDAPSSTITAAMKKAERISAERGIVVPPKVGKHKRAPRKNLTEKMIETIRADIAAGERDHRIAAKLDIDECTVYRIRKMDN